MHPHGTWGTVGAAVAVRKLLGGTVADFARTINIASTLGLATSVKTMREGGTVRNAFAGVTGSMSLLVNELVDAGFTGESDGLSSVFDGVTAHAFRWERMLEGLGRRWEIQRNYFKTHACCRFNHAALDALAVALKAHLEPVVVDEIESIEVHTYSLAAMLVNAQPVNALAAKYSLPFAIATALVHESTGVAAFASEAVGNPVVRRLAQRVRVHEDPTMTKLLPELRQARVVVRLLSGQQFAGFVHTNRGDSDEPLGEEELSRKFIDLARGTWTPVEADGLRRRLLGLDSMSDVSALFDRLSEES
jgi:2-methylcitrate dehydratase PrpD